MDDRSISRNHFLHWDHLTIHRYDYELYNSLNSMYVQPNFPCVGSQISRTQALERKKCFTDVEKSLRYIVMRMKPRDETVCMARPHLRGT